MPISNSASRFLAGLLAAGAMLLAHAPAQASEEFPGAIQEAAGMPCTPACALCHGVTPGTASTFQNKVLGATLFRLGPVLPHNTDQLKGAYAKYAMDPANAAAVMDLKGGIDPETKTGLCGPTYGCAVHVSQEAPARNLSAPLWVLGAVVVGGLLRRRKRAR